MVLDDVFSVMGPFISMVFMVDDVVNWMLDFELVVRLWMTS